MKPILAFRQRLQDIHAGALQSPLPNLAEEMADVTNALRKEYGDFARGGKDHHGIAMAVIAYRKTRELPTYRDLKYVCFGAASEYGVPLARIIEQEALFLPLLEQVEALASEPRKFRRCYQGLLKAYFRYPGTTTHHVEGKKNWLALRDLLARHLPVLLEQKPLLAWTEALHDHRNLLADEPCRPYGQALLAGDDRPIEELKERLGIDGDTWVMHELILAPIQAAIRLPDPEFVAQVLPLVKRLESHPLLVTRGLATLLRRYAECANRPEHHTLRDAALREWKSPWLEANRPLRHAQIGEEATAMVSLWLKQRTIQDFFQLLQADGQADRQRMEFWLKYAECMDEIWLALGQHSLSNNKADYCRIRRQMEGRYMALEGGSYSQDNAFLMKIGGYVFIEFGKQSNACHVFAADNLPFKPRQKSVLGTQDGLKNNYHPGHRAKLMHREGWQWEFANYLSNYADAVPGQAPGRKASPARPSPSPRTTGVAQKNQGIDVAELRTFCAAHGLRVDDHRDKGGALWVTGSSFDEDTVTVLRQAGFMLKQGKGWWLA